MPAIELAVIGGGNMARAILLGAFSAGAIDPARVLIVEPDTAKHADFLGRNAGCIASAQGLIAELGAETPLMLAVKPQVFPEVAGALGDVGDRVVVSIMAGATSGSIRSALGGAARVVRTMPNTPAQVGKGVTAIALGAGARDGDDLLARTLLGSVGRVVAIDESMMDAFTAVVGSGPAYVFALTEAMVEGARAVGFDDATADLIVRGTVEGSAALLAASADRSAGELRAAVTSKGGTTAAGLDVMAERGFSESVQAAVIAARDRGVELGKG